MKNQIQPQFYDENLIMLNCLNQEDLLYKANSSSSMINFLQLSPDKKIIVDSKRVDSMFVKDSNYYINKDYYGSSPSISSTAFSSSSANEVNIEKRIVNLNRTTMSKNLHYI